MKKYLAKSAQSRIMLIGICISVLAFIISLLIHWSTASQLETCNATVGCSTSVEQTLGRILGTLLVGGAILFVAGVILMLVRSAHKAI